MEIAAKLYSAFFFNKAHSLLAHMSTIVLRFCGMVYYPMIKSY